MPLPLVERSKEEIAKAIRKKVEAINRVRGIRHLDVRISGKRLDVDIHAFLDNDLAREDMHGVALDIERVVR